MGILPFLFDRSFLAAAANILEAWAGLAAGDALGATLEFRLPGTFDPITDMISGGIPIRRPRA